MPTYTSQYPPSYNDTYVKATTQETSYYSYNATNPANSLINDQANGWIDTNFQITNQRFHVDLGSDFIIKRIYYENSHHNGGNTNRGAKDFTFWGSNSATAFATLTYGTDTDWTQLAIDDSQFDQHISANQADPKYILVTNTTAYRYYACKIANNWGAADRLGLRRIELQTENFTNTFIPKIIFF